MNDNMMLNVVQAVQFIVCVVAAINSMLFQKLNNILHNLSHAIYASVDQIAAIN